MNYCTYLGKALKKKNSVFLYFLAKGEFMSVFFCIMQGEHDALLPWPFSLPITFTVAAPSEELSLDREVTSQVVREAPPAACVSVTFTPQPTPQLNNYLGRPLNMRNSSLGKVIFSLQCCGNNTINTCYTNYTK